MKTCVTSICVLLSACSFLAHRPTPNARQCVRADGLVVVDTLGAVASGIASIVALLGGFRGGDSTCRGTPDGLGDECSPSNRNDYYATGLGFGLAAAGFTVAAIHGLDVNAHCDALVADPLSPPSSPR